VSGELVSIALLAAVLVAAVLRPHGLPEAVVAVPAALLVWGTDLVSSAAVREELDRLWPILVFLAAVLVLAQLCAAEGLFDAAGHWLARSSRGSAQRLLVEVFVLSAAVTSVLSLDATVVLLTPVVLATAARMHVPARPHVYASGRLANSASLVLPMGNLTNLLALAATGLTLVHFAAAMALPWVVVLLVEYVVLRLYFHTDLAPPAPEALQRRSRFPGSPWWCW
jgi:arsenical pump membrane protein